MKFTKNNINDKSLRAYLINNIQPLSHKQERGSLVNVYDSITTINTLKLRIAKYQRDARYKKWVPLWENHINILEGLK